MEKSEISKELHDLWDKVSQLEDGDKQANEKSIIETLKEINEHFLRNYNIVIENTIIIPLRTEIYYYKEGVFEDTNIHYDKINGRIEYGKKEQRDNFGKVYLHSGFSGLDICLSQSPNYALSILIKNSETINIGTEEKIFQKQYSVASLMKGVVSTTPCSYPCNNTSVLVKKDEYSGKVYTCPRKGLTKETFKNEKLASLIEIKEHSGKKESKDNFDFVTGYGKTRLVTDYIKNHKTEFVNYKSKEDFCNYILGYCPKEVRQSS